MGNKGGNILEKHIDKIILAVIGLICLFVLVRTFVLTSSKVEIGVLKYTPGNVDSEVLRNAKRLEIKVASPPKKEKPDYPENAQAGKFKNFLECSIRDFNDAALVIDTNLYLPIPARMAAGSVKTRTYQMPALAQLKDPMAQLYRSVAFVPTEEVTPDHPYESGNTKSVNTKMEDLDFVTIQAKFDAKTLYDNFNESFAGKNVKDSWKDKDLATPIFARVSLERQQLNDDGTWTQWQPVEQTKINQYRTLFNLPDKISEFDSGGIRTVYARLLSPEVKYELLQPKNYDFAYPSYLWIAPEFEKVRQKQIEKENELIKRQTAAEKEKAKATAQPRTDRTREPAGGPGGMLPGGMPGGAMPGGGGGGGGAMPGGAMPGAVAPRTAKPARADRTRQPAATPRKPADKTAVAAKEENPELDFDDVKIENIEDISKVENLIIWAHDDSTQQGKTYKYRLRIGIANPIAGVAGAKWTDEQENDDRLILWSDYVEAAETIEIPKRMYIFATDIKRDVDKTVSVEVARYMLGNWKKQEFILRPGDFIGKEMEIKKSSTTDTREEAKPVKVDFSTGSLMLDMARNTTWTGRSLLSARSYDEILYTQEDGSIARGPIKRASWDKSMTKMYAEVEDSIANPINLSDSRTSSGSGTRRTPANQPTPGGMPGMPMMPGGMPMLPMP